MNIFSSLKKHISILTYTVPALLVSTTYYLQSAHRVFAFDPTAGCANGINTGLGCLPFETQDFTSTIFGFLVGIAGAISLIILLIATIQIMTGGDNAEQVKKGKELFTGGITGLLFLIFSVVLLQIVAGNIIKLPGF